MRSNKFLCSALISLHKIANIRVFRGFVLTKLTILTTVFSTEAKSAGNVLATSASRCRKQCVVHNIWSIFPNSAKKALMKSDYGCCTVCANTYAVLPVKSFLFNTIGSNTKISSPVLFCGNLLQKKKLFFHIFIDKAYFWQELSMSTDICRLIDL